MLGMSVLGMSMIEVCAEEEVSPEQLFSIFLLSLS